MGSFFDYLKILFIYPKQKISRCLVVSAFLYYFHDILCDIIYKY